MTRGRTWWRDSLVQQLEGQVPDDLLSAIREVTSLTDLHELSWKHPGRIEVTQEEACVIG